MLCEKCGKYDCENLLDITLKSFKNNLPLDTKIIKVCCACWGWFQSTHKCDGNTVNVDEGKPIPLYKLSTYIWGIKAPRQPKKPKTLQDYIEKQKKQKSKKS